MKRFLLHGVKGHVSLKGSLKLARFPVTHGNRASEVALTSTKHSDFHRACLLSQPLSRKPICRGSEKIKERESAHWGSAYRPGSVAWRGLELCKGHHFKENTPEAGLATLGSKQRSAALLPTQFRSVQRFLRDRIWQTTPAESRCSVRVLDQKLCKERFWLVFVILPGSLGQDPDYQPPSASTSPITIQEATLATGQKAPGGGMPPALPCLRE